ncbi:MAG: Periplasmic polysaccharide export protein, partial [Gemmatimonadetes bacterium]|nr:Periplasmic polysaccharide export protein [Gemmatimonadota bacterium]
MPAAAQDAGGKVVTPVAAPAPSTLLDAPINRSTYLLGPGDALDIGVLGDVNRVYTVTVAPEGTILIPGIGVTSLSGLTLDAAQARIRELVLHIYKNVDVRVSLAQVRSFKVFVVGNVMTPGVRTATAVTRVSELIPDATSGPRRRNVLLRRAAGDTVLVDLVRFFQTGDLSANPQLHEGDALIVPTADKTVDIFGRVYFPGTYEFRSGETLAQLLAIANGAGSFPSNAADTVRVSRFTGAEQRELRAFSRAEATGDIGRRYTLEPFDAIFVSTVANYKEQKTAAISGQVLRPGRYPIRPETTTVRELVAMAGGFTGDASLVDATLRRQAVGTEGEAVRQLEKIPLELLSDDERRVLATRNQSDPNVVVIDFQKLFAQGKSALDETVESGDVLTVPVRRTGVTVIGAVITPGIVQYAPGRSADDYVNLAGGYQRKADRPNGMVLKARLGNRTDVRDVKSIDAGDQIIVPFQPPTHYLQTAQQIIGTVTGIFVSIYTIQQLFGNR